MSGGGAMKQITHRKVGYLVSTAAIGAAVLLLALLLGPMANEEARSEDAGYAFTHIKVVDPGSESSDAKVSFDVEWRGSEFPRTQRCVWVAQDEMGRERGRLAVGVTAMDASVNHGDISLPVDGQIATAEPSCASETAAAPETAYEITDVSVEYPWSSEMGVDKDSAVLRLHAAWPAPEKAAAEPRRCTAVMASESGDSFDYPFTLLAADPVNARMKVRVPEGMSPPATARITCEDGRT